MEQTSVADQSGIIDSFAYVDRWAAARPFPPPEAELGPVIRSIIRAGEWLLIHVHEMEFPHPDGRPAVLRTDIALWSSGALDFIGRARPSYEAALGAALGELYRGPVTRMMVRGCEVIDERPELAEPLASALRVLERALEEWQRQNASATPRAG